MIGNKAEIHIADNLIKLRKSVGWTQEQLARKLFVSNKTVSKWERGAGYPEITQLSALARIFGVTVDQLIYEERRGIAVAGNILTDFVKIINDYPPKGMLSNISGLSQAVGGCVPNTAIDLAKIDPAMPLYAFGKVGEDDNGKYLLFELRKYGIDVRGITVSRHTPTSFSDVMSIESTGERTFFHHRGANAEFAPEDVPIASMRCKMLHIGYILLLDQFDVPHPEHGTVMAGFLKAVQEAGIRTSIDAVSDSRGNFAEKIIPALKYTDNVIMNEIEGCSVTGLAARDENGKLLVENIRASMEQILQYGVKSRVILHCPEAGFILNRESGFTMVPSLRLPNGFIKGTVGAGDAFCAGCLYGIYHDIPDCEILRFASGAAACSLAAEDSVSGMKSKEEIETMLKHTQQICL